MEPPYGKRLHSAARQDFKKFWSLYRYWVTFATAFLTPLAFQVKRHGVRSMVNLDETLANGAVGLAVSLVGTYLIAMRRGAEALDSKVQAELNAERGELKTERQSVVHLNAEISALKKPKRTPGEESRYQDAKVQIEKLGGEEKAVLRFLQIHGRIIDHPFAGFSGLPPGVAARDRMEHLLGVLHNRQLVTRVVTRVGPAGQEQTWEIAPGMAAALDELLY